MQDAPAKDVGLTHFHRGKTFASRLATRRVWVATGLIIGLLVLLILLLKGKGSSISAPEIPLPERHPAAMIHAPPFITPPGSTDVLLWVMGVVLAGAVLAVGVLFFWLHSFPERLVHKSTKVHIDIVAVLALLSLFTHVHLFWVAALLLAFVEMPQWSMPDFSSLLGRIAAAIEGRSSAKRGKNEKP
jgi:hypothetical protein